MQQNEKDFQREPFLGQALDQTNRADDDEIEIDLKELFYEFKRNILIILLTGLLCAGVAGVFSSVVLQPVYTSTSMLYVLTKETTLTSLTDLQIGSQLTQDYKELITSRSVMEQVIDNLGLDEDVRELENKITIDNPTNTRILHIAVEDGDPVMAKTITDEIASCASEYIAEIMEMNPPKIVENGEVPIYKTSPHVGRNTLVGAFLGIFAVMGIITLRVVLNDSVRTEDDVWKYLELPVLAVLPEAEEVSASEKNRKTRGKESAEANGPRSRGKHRGNGGKA